MSCHAESRLVVDCDLRLYSCSPTLPFQNARSYCSHDGLCYRRRKPDAYADADATRVCPISNVLPFLSCSEISRKPSYTYRPHSPAAQSSHVTIQPTWPYPYQHHSHNTNSYLNTPTSVKTMHLQTILFGITAFFVPAPIAQSCYSNQKYGLIDNGCAPCKTNYTIISAEGGCGVTKACCRGVCCKSAETSFGR